MDATVRRGILDRAWQKKFELNTTAAVSNAFSIDAGGRVADTVKRIGFLFDAGAVINHVKMSRPSADWREMPSDGVVLTDNSSAIADISQEFPIGDDTAGVYETFIRIRPDTSDFAGLVVSFVGGPKPQNAVIFFNPMSGAVISASTGDYRIEREADGWTKITLASSAAPESHAIRSHPVSEAWETRGTRRDSLRRRRNEQDWPLTRRMTGKLRSIPLSKPRIAHRVRGVMRGQPPNKPLRIRSRRHTRELVHTQRVVCTSTGPGGHRSYGPRAYDRRQDRTTELRKAQNCHLCGSGTFGSGIKQPATPTRSKPRLKPDSSPFQLGSLSPAEDAAARSNRRTAPRVRRSPES